MRKRSGHQLPEWRRYMRFWGKDIDRDIDDELRFHLEMRERDFVAAGLDATAAHDAAFKRFGDVATVTQQLRAHDISRLKSDRRMEFMEALAQDVRYGVRKLVQAPAFTLAVVIVLALGIGVNTAIFSAVDAAMLRPLPFKDAERIAIMENVRIPTAFRMNGALPPKRSPDITDAAAMTDVFERIGAYAPGGLNLTGRGEPVRLKVALATPSLFPMLGVNPAMGRTFAADEVSSASADVAILSHALWQRQFGGDSSIVGKTISLNGIPHVVVGVMPRRFSFPAGTELWIPLPVPYSWEGARREAIRSYLPSTIVVKLMPDVSIARAASRVRALFKPYETKERPFSYREDELVMPLQQTMVSNRRTALLVLMGAAVLVLLTACANVTNLLLLRAASRRREISIRAALGASRRRIVQQLLTESLVLSLIGGVLGIVIAYGSLGLLTALLPSQLVDIAAPTLDARVLGFSLLLATTTGLVFGLWPALGATRKNVSGSIVAGGSHGATSGDSAMMRRLFVVSEMAFALMLLVGAGLMLRSFGTLLRTNTGIDVANIASVELTLPQSRYAATEARLDFYDRLMARLTSAPGVQSAAVVNEIPLRGEWGIGLSVEAEGKPHTPGGEGVYPQYILTSSGYFSTVGIRLLAGRSFDARENAKARVAVINKAMADTLWPGENALGKRFAMGTMPGDKPDYITVVGIVGNARTRSIDEAPTPQMYLPFSSAPSNFAGVVVRGNTEPRILLASLRDALRSTDPEQPIYNLRMLDQAMAQTIVPRRTNTLLISTFGLLAVVLACIGVYAVISYGVAQRTREIGIRIALGARVADVLRIVLREGMQLAVIGIGIGLGGAWALARLMEGLLYGVTVHDTLTFVLAPVVLGFLAFVATWLPARVAARVDPVKAIRME